MLVLLSPPLQAPTTITAPIALLTTKLRIKEPTSPESRCGAGSGVHVDTVQRGGVAVA